MYNIIEIFNRFKKNNPQPSTELNYNSGFDLLIAVILSAQATDKSVNKVTDTLFKRVHNPQEMVLLGEEKLQTYIKSIGLYKNKARNIIKCCEALINNYAGLIPATREELESLAGVGRKTANVVMNTLFKKPYIAVDTHVFRVSNRIGLVKARTPLKAEEQLVTVVPKQYLLNAHNWLVLHGRYVCKASNPLCDDCSLNDLCDFNKKY